MYVPDFDCVLYLFCTTEDLTDIGDRNNRSSDSGHNKNWPGIGSASSSGKAFGWSNRAYCFVESVGIEFVTLTLSLLAFAIVSMFFGAIAVMFALMYQGTDSLSDVAVVGTAGGMIWGFAGAILTVGMTAKLWAIKSHLSV